MKEISKKRILPQEENPEKNKKTITFFQPLDTEEDYFVTDEAEEPSELCKSVLESETEEKENVQENMAQLLEKLFSESSDESENDSSILSPNFR